MSINRAPFTDETPGRFGSIATELAQIIQNLQYSEYELVLFMIEKQVWKGPMPAQPAGFTPGAGSVDYGVYLYWINTPSALAEIASWEIYAAYGTFIALLTEYLGVNNQPYVPPASLLSANNSENYTTIKSGKLIYKDGSVLSIIPYALYDPNWLYALFNLAFTLIWEGYANFSNNPQTTSYTLPQTTKVSIGLLSDWGSGTATAVNVMNALESFNPAYIIHLGDIYYSGTPSGNIDGLYLDENEIQNNFLNQWPLSGYAGKSFTLNGNHEMYSGANGYFSEALADNCFSAQGGCSYGAVKIGEWTILYLDSAYNSTSFDLFMYGVLGSEQTNWIQSLDINDRNKVIVMTHHNGFDPTCDPTPEVEFYQPFWNEVQAALGCDPYAWYWGHVHNAIVYNSPVKVGSIFQTDTRCRCIGNGCLPYGPADALKQTPKIESNFQWCAQYSNPDADELPNGFMILNFQSSYTNHVILITEEYYLMDGTTAKKEFSNVLYYSIL